MFVHVCSSHSVFDHLCLSTSVLLYQPCSVLVLFKLSFSRNCLLALGLLWPCVQQWNNVTETTKTETHSAVLTDSSIVRHILWPLWWTDNLRLHTVCLYMKRCLSPTHWHFSAQFNAWQHILPPTHTFTAAFSPCCRLAASWRSDTLHTKPPGWQLWRFLLTLPVI